ncbi:hypothetical protein [Cellulosimicrobium cellulans]|uniref:hypothetical protein n=1 Tax=Cellulosimicrobium cellulans TaxID=1710 RepID=UPI001BAA6AE8|nr:hypothetical protein [Cellulosimicrobium cellulans]QUC01199.1 hypothetical protein J5A69_08575 [Cellulosimicrobium cellulans]
MKALALAAVAVMAILLASVIAVSPAAGGLDGRATLALTITLGVLITYRAHRRTP